ncbi:hypothetical protein Vi05172_g12092 [Venturia inaequalis]|nr:hypothetical protein Vi05172_g12092 [Venturia inaequalis]
MKFVSALAIALLSVTASAALQGAAMPAVAPVNRGPNPRTACQTNRGPDFMGICKVYSTTDYTRPTGDQVDCLETSPCKVDQNGCVIFYKDGKRVAKCGGTG